MKLLYCEECFDVVLLKRTNTYCSCGKSEGHYLECGLKASVSGPVQVICLHSGDVENGLNLTKNSYICEDRVEMIRAWIAPKRSKNVIWR